MVAAAAAAMFFSVTAHSRALGSQHASGMCLQVSGSSATISRCDSGADQVVDFSGYGHFKIRGQCLDTNGENQPLVLRACNNNDRGQKWAVSPSDNPGALRNEEGWCADIKDEKRTAGAQVIAYKCNPRGSNQKWAFRETTAAAPAVVAAPPAPPLVRPAPLVIDLRQTLVVPTGGGSFSFYTTDSAKRMLGTMDAGGQITISHPANLVGNDGASIVAAGGGNVILPNGNSIPIVAAGGGNIVAAGAGNIVAAGGGNIVAAGGGNIVAAGGGNIAIQPGASLATIVGAGFAGNPGVKMQGGGYSLQSARTVNDLRPQQQASAQPTTAPARGSSGKPIKVELSGKCLDVPYGKFAAGVELVQSDCNNQTNQQFEFTSSGEIKIGGLCVDAYGGSGNAGDRIGLWQCTGNANQKWRADAGQLKGMNNRCIDLVQGSRANGAKFVLWDCHGGANQKLGS